MAAPRIAVLGASGLIGFAVARDLVRRGFAVRALARSFTPSQRAALGEQFHIAPVVTPETGPSPCPLPIGERENKALAELLEGADIVINCIGVLQDGPGSDTDAVHRAFVARLAALCVAAPQKLLIHFSIPGTAAEDRTPFSVSKRQAETLIAESGAPFVILRPGFVIAPAAFGGSALIRTLAMLPVRLPPREARAPFAAVAIGDICETVARVAARWRSGEHAWRESWDVMEAEPGRVGDIINAFRAHGGGPAPLVTLPGWLLTVGAWAGDVVAWLGWRPPVRSTAIAEMRRGVCGDPARWMERTGIAPLPARAAVELLPATIQEAWFARLYLLKAVALAALVIFWCASGLIALTVSFDAARDILVRHGFALPLALAITLGTSAMDFLIGCAIAWRRTSRFGLMAGIAVSLGYMAGAAVIAPELWVEPLGALVKTGPAIVLMLVCLALAENR